MKYYLISHFIGLSSLIALVFVFNIEPYNYLLAIILGTALNINLILYNELHSKFISQLPSEAKG